jgi:hypothetical protein
VEFFLYFLYDIKAFDVDLEGFGLGLCEENLQGFSFQMTFDFRFTVKVSLVSRQSESSLYQTAHFPSSADTLTFTTTSFRFYLKQEISHGLLVPSHYDLGQCLDCS